MLILITHHAVFGEGNEALANASFNAVKILLKLPRWGVLSSFVFSSVKTRWVCLSEIKN